MRSLPQTLTYLVVVLATLLGSASLLLLLFFLFVGSFQLFDLGFGSWVALAWDAFLSAIFFLQHSGMVRRTFQMSLERFFPQRFHGVVFTAGSSTVLLLCLVLWQRVGEPVVQLDGAAGWLVRTLFFLAIAGMVWGVRALGSFDTFGVKPVLAHVRQIQPPQLPFAIKGPYRWARHPLYFFALLLFWACPLMTADRILFNVLWTAWVVLATVLEERDLVSHFGAPYAQFQRDVPMILPWRIPTTRSPGPDTG